ncbi:putative 1,4-dihydroxy-2-naphthoyl-CoA synthase [Helianthus anomalus]
MQLSFSMEWKNVTLIFYGMEEGNEGKTAYMERRPPNFSKFPRQTIIYQILLNNITSFCGFIFVSFSVPGIRANEILFGISLNTSYSCNLLVVALKLLVARI